MAIKRRKRRTFLEGSTIGRWTVLEYVGRKDEGSKRTTRHSYYRCRCECGTERVLNDSSLRPRGKSKTNTVSQSCGCLKTDLARERMIVHGGTANRTRTPEYRCWRSMRHRCKYHIIYINAGIKVCPDWDKSFAAFLRDIGPMPAHGCTPDRIDNSKGYEPGNVRWATRKQQARNKTNNHLATFHGQTRCLTEWAEVLGCSFEALKKWIRRGLTPEQTVERQANRLNWNETGAP